MSNILCIFCSKCANYQCIECGYDLCHNCLKQYENKCGKCKISEKWSNSDYDYLTNNIKKEILILLFILRDNKNIYKVIKELITEKIVRNHIPKCKMMNRIKMHRSFKKLYYDRQMGFVLKLVDKEYRVIGFDDEENGDMTKLTKQEEKLALSMGYKL